MPTRNGISVALKRVSDNQEFPLYEPENPGGGLQSCLIQTIQVEQGDIFFPQVYVYSDFEWYGSNILAVTVNYSYHQAWSQEFVFPWIVRSKEPQTVTVDFRCCPVWNHSWSAMSTQFFCVGVDQISLRS